MSRLHGCELEEGLLVNVIFEESLITFGFFWEQQLVGKYQGYKQRRELEKFVYLDLIKRVTKLESKRRSDLFFLLCFKQSCLSFNPEYRILRTDRTCKGVKGNTVILCTSYHEYTTNYKTYSKWNQHKPPSHGGISCTNETYSK